LDIIFTVTDAVNKLFCIHKWKNYQASTLLNIFRMYIDTCTLFRWWLNSPHLKCWSIDIGKNTWLFNLMIGPSPNSYFRNMNSYIFKIYHLIYFQRKLSKPDKTVHRQCVHSVIFCMIINNSISWSHIIAIKVKMVIWYIMTEI